MYFKIFRSTVCYSYLLYMQSLWIYVYRVGPALQRLLFVEALCRERWEHEGLPVRRLGHEVRGLWPPKASRHVHHGSLTPASHPLEAVLGPILGRNEQRCKGIWTLVAERSGHGRWTLRSSVRARSCLVPRLETSHITEVCLESLLNTRQNEHEEWHGKKSELRAIHSIVDSFIIFHTCPDSFV